MCDNGFGATNTHAATFTIADRSFRSPARDGKISQPGNHGGLPPPIRSRNYYHGSAMCKYQRSPGRFDSQLLIGKFSSLKQRWMQNGGVCHRNRSFSGGGWVFQLDQARGNSRRPDLISGQRNPGPRHVHNSQGGVCRFALHQRRPYQYPRGTATRLPMGIPVKGHLMGYELRPGSLRPLLRNGHQYLVQPSPDFTTAGSSEEQCFFDSSINPDRNNEIRNGVASIYTPISVLEPTRKCVGFRPGSECHDRRSQECRVPGIVHCTSLIPHTGPLVSHFSVRFLEAQPTTLGELAKTCSDPRSGRGPDGRSPESRGCQCNSVQTRATHLAAASRVGCNHLRTSRKGASRKTQTLAWIQLDPGPTPGWLRRSPI